METGQLSALEQFQRAIAPSQGAIDLTAAALAIAQLEFPQLDCDRYRQRLDQMGAEMASRLPQGRYPLRVIRAMNQYLFQELRFQGNFRDYYDPGNSFLNQVLDRRLGIPITLALVYLEVAKRIDFPMAGVGMPGHFLVRPTVEEMAIFVDPFHQGEILFAEDCQNLIHTLYGPGATLRPEQLEPIGPRPFLARMLNNLKAIYHHRQDHRRRLGVLDLLVTLIPDSAGDRRDRGLLYYQQGNLTQAKTDLQAYLSRFPNAPDSFAVSQLLHQIERVEGKGG